MDQSAQMILPIVMLLILLGLTIFFIFIWMRIFTKAGYPRIYGLLMMLPIVNFILLLVLAFGKWPIYEKIDQNKQA